jgi:hypothetical protein
MDVSGVTVPATKEPSVSWIVSTPFWNEEIVPMPLEGAVVGVVGVV